LFNDAPKPLLEKIEQVVRLIRSKGVGIYFVTQSPLDVPDIVLGQMGNRVQHALRAFTPRDQKAVKAAADTFRPNPAFSAAEVISQLGVGEALVSTLADKGVPSMVERTLVRPPSSRIGTISEEERKAVIAASPVGGIYDKAIDRESAFEILSVRVETKVTTETAPAEDEGEAQPGKPGGGGGDILGGIGGMLGGVLGTNRGRGRLTTTQRVARSVTRTVTTRVVGGVAADIGKQLGGSMGGSIGRAIVRGVLGSILRS
jgi:DNA helicase HerA-like ATPase